MNKTKPLATYSDTTVRVLKLALLSLRDGALDAASVDALERLLADAQLNDADAVVEILKRRNARADR